MNTGDWRPGRPDAIVIGAPKAGTTALHGALARHPDVFVSAVKEPKYYLCGDAPPPHYRGPGDRHSQQEWVWRRQDYQALFASAPPGRLRIESTPLYLASADARRRLADDLPDARFVVVVRDPVDRAYSNWMHLWVDGLEPEADFRTAWHREDERIAAGWAPFWHYRRLGRYGEQLTDLFSRVDPDRVLVLRYGDLLTEPRVTLNLVARHLGLRADVVTAVPQDNARGFVAHSRRNEVVAGVIRAGATAGQFVPPQAWRHAVRPLLALRRAGGPSSRPRLAPEVRAELVEYYRADVGVLEELLGRSFADWLSHDDRGSFSDRVAAASTRSTV